MKQILKLIESNNPIIYINGKITENFNYNRLDYSNNCLHTFSYNNTENVLKLGFISEYAMKKISNIV